MKTIDEIIDEVLHQEGGFVNDPADAGGATNMGISLRYARGIGLDLDGDGDTDIDDIRLVDEPTARQCYMEDFYRGPRLHVLPSELQPQLVDIAVLSGPPRAIMLLQETLNRRFGNDLDEDGVMGKATRQAANAACSEFGWQKVNNDLIDARKAFLRALVVRKASQARFINGWLRRAEGFRV